jgi:hypothetical protein
MRVHAVIVSALLLLAATASGADAKAFAKNGGPKGQSNCPEGYRVAPDTNLSRKCRATLEHRWLLFRHRQPGEMSEGPGAGNYNSILQPPEGSNSSSTMQ